MRASIIALAGLLLALPSRLPAQCAFEHPAKAGKIRLTLTQAFVFCSPDGTGSGGVLPNDHTEGGIPACSPPETFGQQSGNYPTRWSFGAGIGTGDLQLKASTKFPANPLNPPGNSADILVQLKLRGVLEYSLGPASGTAQLFLLLRATLDDRASGDMTTVDLPLSTYFPVTSGKAVLKTSVDSMLNGDPMQPGLPTCASVELIYVQIVDPNFDAFAVSGIYLP